jgi:2'-5' RNA ligase
MIRAFFAIALDDDIKQQLFTAGTRLKERLNLSVKWVKENHLHLTLRFLGNIEPSQLELLIQDLSGLEELPSFQLSFSDLIAFPQQKPRVIGMGIQESVPLDNLVHCISQNLDELGLDSENRIFLPHITLGRIAKPRRKSLQLDYLELPKIQHVASVTLFQSQLSPEGSIYSVLHQFPLKP